MDLPRDRAAADGGIEVLSHRVLVQGLDPRDLHPLLPEPREGMFEQTAADPLPSATGYFPTSEADVT